jgi:hypothetical protein
MVVALNDFNNPEDRIQDQALTKGPAAASPAAPSKKKSSGFLSFAKRPSFAKSKSFSKNSQSSLDSANAALESSTKKTSASSIATENAAEAKAAKKAAADKLAAEKVAAEAEAKRMRAAEAAAKQKAAEDAAAVAEAKEAEARAKVEKNAVEAIEKAWNTQMAQRDSGSKREAAKTAAAEAKQAAADAAAAEQATVQARDKSYASMREARLEQVKAQARRLSDWAKQHQLLAVLLLAVLAAGLVALYAPQAEAPAPVVVLKTHQKVAKALIASLKQLQTQLAKLPRHAGAVVNRLVRRPVAA